MSTSKWFDLVSNNDYDTIKGVAHFVVLSIQVGFQLWKLTATHSN